MASAELQNISKLYSVNKSKDFVGPVRIFSESNQGLVFLLLVLNIHIYTLNELSSLEYT